jgi:hypothetical protein
MLMNIADAAAPSLQTAFTTALGTIQSDVMGYIAIALPVSLAIVGAFFGIKKAISFFKHTAN